MKKCVSESRNAHEYRNLSPHTERRLNTDRSTASLQAHGAKHQKRVRVKNSAHSYRPFCNVKKFEDSKAKLERADPTPNPYLTDYEIQMKLAKDSRKAWIAGNFVVTDHKAIVAKRERAVTLVTACGKFDDR